MIPRKARIVHGLPITPKSLLEQLAGSSFCVSYEDRRQTYDAVRLVGEDEIVILDNGAFTAWRQGRPVASWEAFWEWADGVMEDCPQAVAVIPDVICGSEEDNLMLIASAMKGEREDGSRMTSFPERCMPVWHLNESFEQLEKLCRIFNFVAFGSCKEFDINVDREAFVNRAQHAMAVVEWTARKHGIERPWIHMMRGISALDLVGFDSADSTNIARNHNRTKGQDGHVAAMAQKIDAKVHDRRRALAAAQAQARAA